LSDSAAAFTVCAGLRPKAPWPHFNRGLVRLRQKLYEEAEADFSEALRLKPEWTAAMINRAIAREHLKSFAEAEKDLTAALAQPDAPTRIYFLRSRVRAEAGNKAGAERDAGDALKRKPSDSVSWVTRGVWRMNMSAEDALSDFNEALKLDARSRDALQNKAVLLADYLHKPAEAAKVMDQLLDFYPLYIEARAGRGVYRARAGDAKGAREDAAVCLREEPNAFRYYQMAGLYAQLSRRETDGKARREALRLLALALRSGFTDLNLMKKDSDLDPIRSTEDYQSLVAHAGALQRP
jgi:tetratricopeptide (TPR) repeat protein